MADRYWVGGAGTWDTSSTTVWSTSSGGASGASVPTATDSVFFDIGSGVPGTVTLTGALACLDITVSLVGWTFASTGTIAISGSMSLTALTTWTGTGTLTFNATATGKTITTNGVSLACAVTFNGVGGAWTLGSALTITGLPTATCTLTNGTLALSSFTLTCNDFQSNNANTRTLNFGTGNITLTGYVASGSIWNTSTITGLTVSGTTSVTGTYSGGADKTYSPGALAEASAISFTFQHSGAGANTLTVGSTLKDITMNGTSVACAGAATIYGNLTHQTSSASFGGASCDVTMAATSAKTITSNSVAVNLKSINFNGVAGSWALQDSLDLSTSITTVTITNGTLNANGFNLTCGKLASSGTATRVLAFGAGTWTLTGSGANVGTVLDLTTVTGLTTTGTQALTLTGGSGTVIPGSLNEANSISLNITTGSGSTSITSGSIKNLILTGFTGTLANTALTIYGNLNVASGMTLTAGGSVWTFAATASKTITTNAKTLDFPLTFNGVAGTWTLQDALTLGSTRALTLTAGTFNANTYNVTIGALTNSSGSTRTLAFGSGAWSITGNNATVYNNNTTGLTVTGTKKLSFTYSGAVGTRTFVPGIPTEANAVDIYVTAGSDAFARSNAVVAIGALVLTGFTGTLSFNNNAAKTFYGDFILASGMVAAPSMGNQICTFGKTSGTQIISFNGIIPFWQGGITISGAGTHQLGSNANFTSGSQVTTLSGGTLDLNGFTLTADSFATGAGTKNITFNAGTLTVVGSGATAFNNFLSTNFTTTAGTGTGYISMTSASAKTFVGGGSTFNCTLSQDGAGALTITGSNTLADIRNTTQPVSVLFTAGTTTTFTSGFSLSGTAGNLVTIGSVTAASHTLSKASGTVDVSYCSISRSSATGGATWLAYI